MRLWDVRSGQQVHHFSDDHLGHFVGDDDQIIVGSQDGTISLWRHVGDEGAKPSSPSGQVVVEIPDANLERVIRDAIGKPHGADRA